MRLKRTNSFTRSNQQIEQTIAQTVLSPKHQTLLSHNQQTIHNNALRQLTRSPNTPQITPHLTQSFQRTTQNTQGKAQSVLGTLVRTGFKKIVRSIKDKAICQMCDGQIRLPKDKNNEIYMCRCDHRNMYCQGCLLQYVIYHVKKSEEVLCPHQGCNTLLDTSTRFFKNLPIEIQQDYIALRSFLMASKQQNIKICPRQHCHGILTMHHQHYAMLCNHCAHAFCPRCLNSVHQGPCQPFDVQFFQSSIKYQQCPRCNSMIDKKEGSNRLHCRCGIQLCYVCRRTWIPAHQGTHNQRGQVILAIEKSIEIHEKNQDHKLMSIVKIPLKVILFLALVPLMFLLYLMRDLLILVFMILFSVVAGLFGFSFELVFKATGIACFLAVLFFPVTMLIGIGVGFRQVFCEIYPNVRSGVCTFGEKIKDIYNF